MPTHSQILCSQLRAAAQIWAEIQNTPQPADRWLHSYFARNRKFGSRDRRFLSEITFSLFRHKTFLEIWARQIGGHPEPFAPQPQDDSVLPILSAAAENLITLEQFKGLLPTAICTRYTVPGTGTEEALFQSLKEKALPPGLVSYPREEQLALRYSFPEWAIKGWIQQYGYEKTEALAAFFMKRPELCVRANPVKISREDLMKRFQEMGCQVRPSAQARNGILFSERAVLGDTEEYRRGYFEIQDEGSQLICERMNVRPDDQIWDVCAGAGGKTLYLAALAKGRGEVFATDTRESALEELWERRKRAGLKNIRAAAVKKEKAYDKILVDAPCSGTGRLRREPDRKWKLKPEDFQNFQAKQIALLESVIPYLKEDGQLFYATCSLERQENEEVIEAVLRKHSQMERARQDERLWPPATGTDGFFLAALKK